MLTENQNQMLFDQLLRLQATATRVETKLDVVVTKQEDIDDRLGSVEKSAGRAKGFLAALATVASMLGAERLSQLLIGFSGGGG